MSAKILVTTVVARANTAGSVHSSSIVIDLDSIIAAEKAIENINSASHQKSVAIAGANVLVTAIALF